MGTLHPLRPAPSATAGTAYVGAVLFVASWSVLFAALFFAYGLIRLRAPVWPPLEAAEPLWWPPRAATALLVGSSLALAAGFAAGREGARATARAWLLAAFFGGVGFLACQAWSLYDLWQQGEALSSAFGGVFFGLLGFHALHVVACLLVLGGAWWAVGRGQDERAWLRAAELFWHFLGIVWVLLFLAIYVL
jgi:heme/copper-type cytochrome/quinol oxidase subunit 3